METLNFDISSLPTPCYVIDESLLVKNLEKLESVKKQTGCKILLAQKAFSTYATYPLIAKYLDGATASSLFEARLGFEEMGKENHIFSPSFLEREFDEIKLLCDHVVFNSIAGWKKFKTKAEGVSCGLRVNPEYAEIETDMYNPCFKGSRLGALSSSFDETDLDGLEGLHFHAMCEQNSDTLKRILQVFEDKFGKYLSKMKWVNFGGGHHITRDDYDVNTLVECILHFKDKYGVQVYLEPGEAVALNAGFLVTEVLEVIENDISIAIVDTSASCHMPDVLEMPYRPNIIGSGKANEKKYTYRLGSNTCLAGDIISGYSFDAPLKEGTRLVLCDMAIYSMVKNNTFNGINLPAIVLCKQSGETVVLKEFGYDDFKMRL